MRSPQVGERDVAIGRAQLPSYTVKWLEREMSWMASNYLLSIEAVRSC